MLQQLEDFNDGTMTVNDAFRPISRYFDRIMRPEQLLTALPRAFATMTDPAECGPVTLAFCQDVQAEAYDWPAEFFAPKEWHRRRPRPGPARGQGRRRRHPRREAAADHRRRRRALRRGDRRADQAFAEKHNIPVGETQAGKSSMPWDHPLNLGSIGVTGSAATNAVAAEADVIVGVGTRLQDFTTGSWSLFQGENRRIVAINVTPYDTHKHNALPLVADARLALDEISQLLGDHRAPDLDPALKADWIAAVDEVTARPDRQRAADRHAGDRRGAAQPRPTTPSWSAPPAACRASCTSSGRRRARTATTWNTASRPWATRSPAALGVKMAHPDREVVVMVGDGSYMMLNSELATSVMLGHKIIVVLLDNRGYGCINRLQIECRRRELQQPHRHRPPRAVPSAIDFAAHAAVDGRDRREGRLHRRARGGDGPRPRRATAATSSSSTPTRCRPPRPAATGGTSSCPRSRRAPRCRRPARAYERKRELQRLAD